MGKLFVTVFAIPHLDMLHSALYLQPFNTIHHPNVIPKPAARDDANTRPYQRSIESK
jgi:hypothetical protein